MNLRILNKLSKRAAPLLQQLGDTREQFHAGHDSYHESRGMERKHWDRMRAKYPMAGSLVIRPRDGGNDIVLREPWHPWPGTVMVGAMTGYEEPEWSEQCAWDSLVDRVHWHFTEFEMDSKGEVQARGIRRLVSVTDYFRAAKDMAGGSAA